VLAFASAYILARKRAPGRGLINVLVILPWALPGTVLAMALASTFSVNQPWFGRFVLIGTGAILPLAYFIRNIPLVTRAALTSFRQLDPALEEAAASLGARWLTTARRVTLPLVLPGIAAGALLAFVTALGEFVASILLYTHRTRPISIEILAQLRAFDFGAAAAYAVLLIILEAAASLGARWLTTARRVTLPLVLPGIAAGALLAFVTALGEFVASILLYTHRTRPISIEILAQLRAFDFGAAAAYAVLLIILM